MWTAPRTRPSVIDTGIGTARLDAETTRLVLRIRAATPPGWRATVLLALLDPQDFVMVRAQLRGIRRRAEALAEARR